LPGRRFRSRDRVGGGRAEQDASNKTKIETGCAMKDDAVSLSLQRFLDQLSGPDRETLVALLREPSTYLAEDMADVLAILEGLES
jgi:hypothetical protein